VSLISRSCFSVSTELSTSVHRCVGVKYEGRIFSPVNFFCGGQNLLKFTIAEGLYTWHIPTHTLLSSNKQYLKRHISTRTNIFSKKQLSKLTDIGRLHYRSRLFFAFGLTSIGYFATKVFSLMQGKNSQSWLDFDFWNYHKEFEYFSHSEGFLSLLGCWGAVLFLDTLMRWTLQNGIWGGGIYTNMDYVLTFCLLSFKS